MPWLDIDEATKIRYERRVSTRARTLCLRVLPGGTIELVVPKNKQSSPDIQTFLVAKQAWMLKYWQQEQNNPYRWPTYYTCGQTLPLAGSRVPLTIVPHALPRLQVRYVQEKGIVIHCPASRMGPQMIKKGLIQWYREICRVQVEKALDMLSPQLGVRPAQISIRDNRQYWGALAGQVMHINWLLMLAPMVVLKYVVAHELCHFFEKRHNPKFWARVSEIDPNYKTSEDWLKRHGVLLAKP